MRHPGSIYRLFEPNRTPLGIGDEIGSIEPGKRANLIVLDLDKPKITPLTYDGRTDIDHVDMPTLVIHGPADGIVLESWNCVPVP